MPRRSYPNRDTIHGEKIRIVRLIIQESRAPISAREISRRILGRGESQVYHMMPSEVSAIIRIHMSDEVSSQSICVGGAVMLHYDLVSKVQEGAKEALATA